MSGEITNEDIAKRRRRNYRQMPPEERMSVYEKKHRKELTDEIEKSLAKTLGVPRAVVAGRVPYTVTAAGTRKLLFRFHVEPVGWPTHIAYDSPGELSGAEVCQLIWLLRRGRLWFRRLRRRELEAAAAANDGTSLHACLTGPLAWREDARSGAQVRRPETQSKRMASRRPLVIKTAETVVDDE